MRRYHYLFSYTFKTKDNHGQGSTYFSINYPITELSDIQRIISAIKTTFDKDEDVTVAIMSYQLIGEDSIWGRK